jgi:hypothetical protein
MSPTFKESLYWRGRHPDGRRAEIRISLTTGPSGPAKGKLRVRWFSPGGDMVGETEQDGDRTTFEAEIGKARAAGFA